MLTRIVVAVAGALLAVSSSVVAQTRTVPPTIDFTCHGYVETGRGTRAYNCIPVASQQPQMRTFVPPPGSPCTEGVIDEFPPGRIVFQIRCQDSGAPPPRPGWTRSGSGPAILDLPQHIQRIRVEGAYSGDSENFVVWCGVTGDRGGLIVNEILGTSTIASGTRYSGVHSARRSYGGRGQPCRELQVEHSIGINWTISEVGANMLLPEMRTLNEDQTAVEMLRAVVRPDDNVPSR